uniref:Uncharacterized protein n=1 Tax=Onchocerca volvulus TaxID=6282 RepID=A0A8R1TL80_ONCVO
MRSGITTNHFYNPQVCAWIAKVASRCVSLMLLMQPRMIRIEKYYFTALILHGIGFHTNTCVCTYVLEIEVWRLSAHMIRESVQK